MLRLRLFHGMEIKDLQAFSEIEKACGNRYIAVQLISDIARRLGQHTKEYQISESKLLEWILTGQCPYSKSQLEARRERPADRALDDLLCWVSDESVVKLVRKFYKQSIKQRHLVECFDEKLHPSRIDRANILLRMHWYSANN